MKVPGSVRAAYDRQLPVNVRVHADAESLILAGIPRTWHYEGRLKEPESFALKLETGRFDPEALEDFFACTIVVPTLADIGQAESLITSLFDLVYRRPPDVVTAGFAPDFFGFDYLRLYVRLRVPPGLTNSPIHETTFEVQIKTFL